MVIQKILSVSQYLNINKVEYIDRMKAFQGKCDYEQWTKLYINTILLTADHSLQNIRKWLKIWGENLFMIEKAGKSITVIWSIYDSIEQQPIFDIKTIAQRVGISYNTGAAAIKHLAGMGIVQQLNQAERYRGYAYTSFLDCFTDRDINCNPSE